MADIILATLNAKYIHSAFGLRYLLANMGELGEATRLLEFDINTRPADVAEAILKENPRILGLGVYIWNAAQTTSLVRILKKIYPDLTIILGGPEVSYETEIQSIAQAADFVICGEGDLAFAELCRKLVCGERPAEKILRPPLPDLGRIRLPYDLYTDEDLAHRVIYIESSRGCPFSCEFCLSSLDLPVRQFPREPLFAAMDALLRRGVKQLKFVDRTFNVRLDSSLGILNFLLERYEPGHFFHFEVVPDRLPPELREALAKFPPGALQLEAGVQTFNPEVAQRISRRQNYARLEDNLRFLRASTGAHIHADLIAGLPGEGLESFASGFNRLVALDPHEIQLGILKRLKGTPIVRHDLEWEMAYSPEPPFEILRNKQLSFQEIQRLKRFARYWDLVANSGNFVESAPLIWESISAGPFDAFLNFSDWLYGRFGRTDSIALPRLTQALHDYLIGVPGVESHRVAASLWRDYQRAGRREMPEFLAGYDLPKVPRASHALPDIPKRQRRRAGTAGEPLAKS